ncbi:MAG TPA: hypothetical protein VKV22_11510 [Rhodanobacteraceae bacterium]|nr:hypothetical protein [Rhodanobacteraceae bacterium]
MTTTDIGILLIVLCIVLWAIMAALHRHTVQLEALKTQMQELLNARQAQPAGSGRDAEAAHPPTQRGKVEPLTPHASTSNPAHPARRTFSD